MLDHSPDHRRRILARVLARNELRLRAAQAHRDHHRVVTARRHLLLAEALAVVYLARWPHPLAEDDRPNLA